MNVSLITIGKTKTSYLIQGIEEYLKRLGHYLPLNIVQIPDLKNASRLSRDEQKEAEGALILQKILPGDHTVLLDERGRQYTSEEYASKLQGFMVSGLKRLNLVIGGPFGFSKAVYDKADELMSLSKMTFNHEMIRLFILEQTYRAMTILRGEKYHHA